MNKKAIAATALCRYKKDERVFVVESPIFDRVIGVGRTKDEAWKLFKELLDETYVAYLEGTLVGYEKRGRPAKHNVEFHAQVKLEVKKLIKEKAEALGISQGEVIAYWAAIEHVKIELEQRLDKMEKAQIKVVPKRRKAVG
jgi:predicted RNase H-like HicB family nuclease